VSAFWDAQKRDLANVFEAINVAGDGITSAVKELKEGVRQLKDEIVESRKALRANDFDDPLGAELNRITDSIDGLTTGAKEAIENALKLDMVQSLGDTNARLTLQLSEQTQEIERLKGLLNGGAKPGSESAAAAGVSGSPQEADAAVHRGAAGGEARESECDTGTDQRPDREPAGLHQGADAESVTVDGSVDLGRSNAAAGGS
jgi:transposase